MHVFGPALTRIRKALENRTNMEDDRVAILEAQLSQAKLIAEESDKKYEEVNACTIMLLNTRGWYCFVDSHTAQLFTMPAIFEHKWQIVQWWDSY